MGWRRSKNGEGMGGRRGEKRKKGSDKAGRRRNKIKSPDKEASAPLLVICTQIAPQSLGRKTNNTYNTLSNAACYVHYIPHSQTGLGMRLTQCCTLYTSRQVGPNSLPCHCGLWWTQLTFPSASPTHSECGSHPGPQRLVAVGGGKKLQMEGLDIATCTEEQAERGACDPL